MALKALAILRRDYPDIKLITTGEDPRAAGWRAKLRRSSYARYLAKLMHELGLEDRVEFLGGLSAEQMRDQYLRAHVALNPSSIENSSNAIGEAQVLGVPVVASYVGGTPDLMDGLSDGLLYPFDEPYMLAYCVDQILASDEYAQRLSEYGREAAWHRHHRVINQRELWSIYQQLSNAPEQKG
ncbi:D-inositol-3-phosphate glycosyltransferase [bioreactor metagenome]|uniref:D-inositol-3-phosphate glycosyltransferase n=1 Tax=bioreactor metagenome TaxID=1076179 RepID=A0A645GCV7_9ZZZZ